MVDSIRTAIIEEMTREGWDPGEPCEECYSATRRPAMPAHLSRIDVVGIHRRLVRLQLYQRFLRGLSWTGKEKHTTLARACVLDDVALQFVLNDPDFHLGGKSTSAGLALALDNWGREVLLPSLEKVPGLEKPPEDPRPYEPGFTFARLTY